MANLPYSSGAKTRVKIGSNENGTSARKTFDPR